MKELGAEHTSQWNPFPVVIALKVNNVYARMESGLNFPLTGGQLVQRDAEMSVRTSLCMSPPTYTAWPGRYVGPRTAAFSGVEPREGLFDLGSHTVCWLLGKFLCDDRSAVCSNPCVSCQVLQSILLTVSSADSLNIYIFHV